MAKRISAEEAANQIAELVEQVKTSSIADTREDAATAVEDHFLGRRGVSRSTYSGASPDECILDALATYPTLNDPRLSAALVRMAEGVTEDFRAGLLMAVRLVGDHDYDL